jgi:hypothetical protein
MEENMQSEQKVVEFKFKADKIEKYLSFGFLAIFFLSFKNIIATYAFYTFGILVFIYYFGWYRRNKLPYVKITGDEIAILEGLFFKPCAINKSELKGIKKIGSKIELTLNSGRKVNIFEILLSAADFKDLQDTLKSILRHD